MLAARPSDDEEARWRAFIYAAAETARLMKTGRADPAPLAAARARVAPGRGRAGALMPLSQRRTGSPLYRLFKLTEGWAAQSPLLRAACGPELAELAQLALAEIDAAKPRARPDLEA